MPLKNSVIANSLFLVFTNAFSIRQVPEYLNFMHCYIMNSSFLQLKNKG